MSRLLHAAARGARINPPRTYAYSLLRMADGKAESKPYWHFVNDENCYIHPEDEALQYGPISTALREMAEDPPSIVDTIHPVERHYLNVYKYSDEMYMWADGLHKSLMILLVAEALADEGL